MIRYELLYELELKTILYEVIRKEDGEKCLLLSKRMYDIKIYQITPKKLTVKKM